MSRNRKILIGVAIVVLLGAIAFANFRYKRTPGVTVTTEGIQKRRLEAIVSASGKIQPKTSVNISADTMGRVTNLAVEEGQRVEKGQFLLQIDPRILRTNVTRTEASLAAAKSQMEQGRLALDSAQVAVKQAEDAFRRQQELMKGGLTTREQYERAENDLKMRQSDLRSATQSVRTQELRMRQESATAESARFDLSKVRIESPITGIVTRRNIEEGETVVIGTMNNAGTVLLTVADMSVIEAEVEVDETDIPTVTLGQKAQVTIDALPDKKFTGKVTEIGNSPIQATGAAAAQRQNTNFKVVVTLDTEVPDVRPGFTCTAEITTAIRDNAVAVPIQATTVREVTLDAKGNVVHEPKTDRRRRAAAAAAPDASGTAQAADGTAAAAGSAKPGNKKETEGVFVVRNGAAEFVPVKTGIAGDKYFEVLSGLKEGDQVIVGPFNSVRDLADGDPVKPEAQKPGATDKT
ncbi:MAG: hypothetical protein A3H96_16210 [Acidobacteria bacterium RIFCSPLOWO2_02_FULL_67_36]|nr:MAG: hypothetical protein A3H96_16210 [Acidobacteria bacterium RIFCSPLOWO2_02_FULL_67_36]OFW21261.1 MAG: hypothetical protein A3G21_11425 [Acidobacteria bacterium RIFCSPLOWO2_12_FULL_66_21]